MANLTVIDTYRTANPAMDYAVREPEAPYRAIHQVLHDLLDRPNWPLFLDGAYLSPEQATHFYRTTHAMMGIAKILGNAASQRGNAETFADAPPPLGEMQQSQLHAALIELSVRMTEFAEEMHERDAQQPR